MKLSNIFLILVVVTLPSIASGRQHKDVEKSFLSRLTQNIITYSKAYYRWNHLLLKKRDVPTRDNVGLVMADPVKMKIADIVGGDFEQVKRDLDNFESDFPTRDNVGLVMAGPVRMKIADIVGGDFEQVKRDLDNFESDGPMRNKVEAVMAGPLKMKIGDIVGGDFEKVKRDLDNFESDGPMRDNVGVVMAGPVRMKIADIVGGDFEQVKRDFDNFESDVPMRDKVGVVMAGPVRMKIADIKGSDFEQVKRDLDNFETRKRQEETVFSLPLKMKIADSPKMNVFSAVAQTEKERSYPVERTLIEVLDIDWFNFVSFLEQKPSRNYGVFFNEWIYYLNLFKNNTRVTFSENFPKLPLKKSLSKIGLVDPFIRLFWPFRLDVAFMNQKLSLLGISGKSSKNNIKTSFFKTLETIQTVSIPVEENNVVYSFDHPNLIEGMNRSGLLENSKEFVDSNRHLFTKDEIPHIVKKVDSAFELINATSPILFKAIQQLVGCIAFYKAETPGHLGGTVSSALGVIWLDPSVDYDWSVPFYAEQIVHEYIHTSLFYAELVHGTFTDHTKFSEAKVISSIRRQLRDYDKSFHAAYVATGLVNFHTRAGFLNRAMQLAAPLSQSIRDLVKVNIQTQILNESGAAMLQSMVDFLTAARLM